MKSLLTSLLLLALVAPTWAADLLIFNPIGVYEPQLSTLRDGIPGSDGLSGYVGHSLTYAGSEGDIQVEIREYDDTRWLAHNVEGQLRHTAAANRLGERSETAIVKIFAEGSALCLDSVTDHCWWVSGNRAVHISGRAPDRVIEAYLARLTPTHAAFSADADWADAEIERLLATAGRRLALLAQGGAGTDLQAWIHRDLNTFLQYRENYYGMDAAPERVKLGETIRDGNETLLREKLQEYRDWWLSIHR
jgi:hypothetical protein